MTSNTQSTSPIAASRVKELAREAGFDLCGIATPEIPADDVARYRAWLAKGCDAGMTYMDRYLEVRADPRRLMKATRAIVCCAVNYNAPFPKSIEAANVGQASRLSQPEAQLKSDRRDACPTLRAWISRYAWGDDYHNVVRAMLNELSRLIARDLADTDPAFKLKARGCVDTAPLFERSLAARAGLGWIGRNGCLIHPKLGSYLFLGELLVNLDLPPDTPVKPRCGECHRCQEACPGGAIGSPGVVDARRCASYLTIEHRGDFDEAQGRAITRNVFGCDICQDVCPWNRRAPATARAEFQPRPGAFNPPAEELEALDKAGFDTRFAGSAVLRCGLQRLCRNLRWIRKIALEAQPL